jgi:hypothetical protein
MKKSTLVIGLGLAIMVCGSGTFARNESSQRSGSSSSVRSSSSGGGYSRGSSGGYQGAAKVSARGGSYSGSGYRGGGGHYFHQGFRGHYGWGSQWPSWSVGAYFSYLPDDYTAYYVDGSPYYYCDGSYFSPYSDGGYIVVPAPDLSNATMPEPMVQAAPETVPQPVAEQSQSASTGAIVINVPNSKGGFTPVKLVKGKDGYVGPQGEYYPGHPTIAALRVLYGD